MVARMSGGIAVERNILCIAHGEAHGQILLVDLSDGRLVSRFRFSGRDGDFADAAAVALDTNFAVFVADTRNDLVRRFTALGREVGQFGRAVDRGPGAVERDRVGTLDRPRAVAVHDGQLWVAGGDRKLIRGLQRFDIATGEALGYVRSLGEEDRRYGAPRGLCVDAEGVLLADTLHGLVQRFTADARFVGFVRTAADPADTSRPVAVLRLAGGDLLVADQGDRGGVFRVGLAGERRAGPDGRFEDPTALARDGRGNIYVLDRHGERVHRLAPDLRYLGVVVDLAELPCE